MKKSIKLIIVFLTAAMLLCSCSNGSTNDNSETTVAQTTESLVTEATQEQPKTSEIKSTETTVTTAERVYEELPDADIRNLKWGMSLEEVKVYETERNYTEEVSDDSTLLIYQNVDFNGYTSEMTLSILNEDNGIYKKGLDGVNYRIVGDKYTEFYNSIVNEYGTADSDSSSMATWNVSEKNYIIMLLSYNEGTNVITQYSFFPLFESINEDENNFSTTNAITTSKTSFPTLGEKNALSAAKNYLDVMPFSYSGLIEQLEFEGYSTSEATYGADNCGADWNKQAEKAAANYLAIMPFSKQELIEQLEFEGYTHSQAVHGAEANGY